jgi:hypothetical protein
VEGIADHAAGCVGVSLAAGADYGDRVAFTIAVLPAVLFLGRQSGYVGFLVVLGYAAFSRAST